ncbi:hypothetical protein [Actinomadura logoneensis]|uniref:hypothetical protein n=1 Tax=Actinomadura logoneensis TaxID=2293572 RepID=UPI001313F9E7|nr:hypothetical protein [Actinomadura logoneensis]
MTLPPSSALCVAFPDVRATLPVPVAVLVVVLVLRGVDPGWAVAVAASLVPLRTPSR